MTSVSTTPEADWPIDPWLNDLHWAPARLTYSFPTDGTAYSYQPRYAVRALGAGQQEAIRAILDEISSFTGLTFTEVASGGTLRFAREAGLEGGYAYLPDAGETGGDVFVGTNVLHPTVGNEAWLYMLHETGHALGLLHGHDFPGFASSKWNSQEFTVMTYADFVGDKKIFSYDSGPVDWAQSYMQLDIAALQSLYGANYAERGEIWSGNTVYGFDPNTGEMIINGVGQGTPAGNRIYRTIWDGNGRDTYDLSTYETDLSIDLRPGAWSTFSDTQLADLDRTSDNPDRIARGNLANARLFEGDTRSLIEDAIGGAGDDAIMGNGARNRLSGGAGADHLQGGGGADRLRGQGGDDRLEGGRGADTLIGGAGHDRLVGGTGRDSFVYRTPSDAPAEGRAERIVDFEAGRDYIDLTGLDLAGAHVTTDNLPGDGPAISLQLKSAGTLVAIDSDGDGSADLRLLLLNTQTLGQGDFLL